MANPALNEKSFQYALEHYDNDTMTLNGAINKAIILSLILMLSALVSVYFVIFRNPQLLYPSILVSSIASFILAFIMCFKKEMAKSLSILYAICEGVAIGSISFIFNQFYSGIVVQAIFLTFLDLFVMLMLYKFRIIKVNDKVRSLIVGATLCIGVLYFINIIMGFFGKSIPFLYNSSPIGIGVSIVIVAIASFNLLLDFDTMERAANNNMPKYFEWYCAFGILVTLVWLYLEILKLLAKINDRK